MVGILIIITRLLIINQALDSRKRMKRCTAYLFFILFLTNVYAAIENDTSNTNNNPKPDFEGPDARIVGGHNSGKGSYPYIALLGVTDRGSRSLRKWWCSGTLIAPDIILSASHCAGGITGALFGAHDLRSNTESRTLIRVNENIKHPSFSTRSLRNDIAVFVLDTPLMNVNPVSINQSGSKPAKDDKLSVVGWGDTNGKGSFPNIQQEVEVFYTSCGDYRTSWITDDMMCAGADGKDACSGDSGGPIIDIGQPNDSNDDIQVGIVSWGDGCANDRFPGVYSRISDNYAWVRDQVCENSKHPPSTFNCVEPEDEKFINCVDENPRFWWGILDCDSGGFLVCFLYADYCRNTCDLC